jgi:hypothetical protein
MLHVSAHTPQSLSKLAGLIALAAIVLQGCTVKINGKFGSKSSATTAVATTPLALTSFTGAGDYMGGSVQSITWDATVPEGVTLSSNPISLDYSVDDGSTWTSITANESNSGTYAWTLPLIDSASVRVRVTATDASGNALSDSSDASFRIDSTVPSVALSSLDGGGAYRGSSSQSLTWTASDSGSGLGATSMSFEYSSDGGATWTAIAANEANDSTYSWSLPAALSSQTVRVRVIATDVAGNQANDFSAADFTIDSTNPAVTLTSLTGGATYAGGSSQAITWTAATDNFALAASPITLEYSTNGGTSWTSIATGEANDGTYTWNPLPSIDSATVRVRVTAADAVGTTATSASTSNFTIDSSGPVLAITAPTGAAVLRGGSSESITWTATDVSNLPANPITLEYTTNNGVSWTSIATNEANDGAYTWSAPSINSQTVKLRITAVDTIGNSTAVISATNFTIDSTDPAVTLTSFTGGGSYVAGSSQAITWTAATDNFGLRTNPIVLHYSTNSGSTWTQIATNEANDGTYSWTLPNISSSTVRVRVTALDAAGNTAFSQSTSDFTIDNANPVIALTSFTGGGSYIGGSSQSITWTVATDNLGLPATPITLHYSTNNGTNWTPIASNEANDGSYTWTLPAINSDDIRVRVTVVDSAGNTASDASSSDFTIDSANPAVTLTSPLGGQTYAGGASQNITWNAATDNILLATNPISLEYSTNSGSTWTSIATGEANDGTYAWTVPSINSTTVRVRVIAQDRAGNSANSASTSDLAIDSTAPTATSLSINGGAASTTSQTVTLTLAATGASTMCIQEAANCTGCSTYVAFATTVNNYALSAGVGSKTVAASIRDAAGNAVCETDAINFTTDADPPTSPTISINGGAASTNFRNVSLALSATESVSTPMEMCISESATCAGCSYEAYATSKTFQVTAGAATKTVGVKYRDAAGNETACVTDDIDTVAISVAARFSNAQHWNDYARRCAAGNNSCASGMPAENATACAGTETGGANACIHGGDRRKVATVETACTGITASDSLGAFDWSCELVGGVATFYSQLKPSKGLADLVTHGSPTGSWKTNFVTLTKSAENITTSTTAWWNTTNNPVHELPDNSSACPNPGADTAWTCSANTVILGAAGTVYTASSSRATLGYNVNADKVSVVTVGSSTVLSGGTMADNCITDTGGNWANAMEYGTTNADACLVAIGNQKFAWVEGMYQGSASTNYIVGLQSATYSQFRRLWLGLSAGNNLYLRNGTSNNRFSQIRSVGSGGGAGINLIVNTAGKITGNLFWDINSSSSGSEGISLKSDVDYNVFSNLVLSNNDSSGVQMRGDQFSGDDANMKFNTLSRVTSVDNRDSGFRIWTDGSSPVPDTVLHNFLVAGNGNNGYAVHFERSGVDIQRPTLSQFAVSRNVNTTGGIFFDGVANGKITGNLLVGNNTTGDCLVTGGTAPGLTATTCATAGASDHTLVGSVDVSSSFVYKALSDSVNTAENASGISTGNNILVSPANLFSFDNFFRSWGTSNGSAWPDTGLNGRCFFDGSNCQMLDWSLLAAASVIRNVTGNGSTANSAVTGGACPTEANGTNYLTSASYTYDSGYISGLNGVEVSGGDADGVCESGETCAQRYLAAASETFDDGLGDEDGLCETGEACVYTPNFGAYQGHGTLTSCTFTGGTITGVSMSYYPTNGY